MANTVWTGREGIYHEDVMKKGKIWWAALIDGEWKLFTDSDETFKHIWENTEADEFVRIKAYDESDALLHADKAFSQWAEDNDPPLG